MGQEVEHGRVPRLEIHSMRSKCRSESIGGPLHSTLRWGVGGGGGAMAVSTGRGDYHPFGSDCILIVPSVLFQINSNLFLVFCKLPIDTIYSMF